MNPQEIVEGLETYLAREVFKARVPRGWNTNGTTRAFSDGQKEMATKILRKIKEAKAYEGK